MSALFVGRLSRPCDGCCQTVEKQVASYSPNGHPARTDRAPLPLPHLPCKQQPGPDASAVWRRADGCPGSRWAAEPQLTR